MSSAASPAASTRRLKSSFSIEPSKTRANASSNLPSTLPRSMSRSLPVERPKSCSHTGAPSAGWMRYGRSSSTRRPMRSSIGRLSESGTGPPRWKSLSRSVPGAASSGRCRFRPSVPFAATRAAICASLTAARAATSSRYEAGNPPRSSRSRRLPSASPAPSTSAAARSSSHRRAAAASAASSAARSTAGICPGTVCTVIMIRASTDSDRNTLKSEPRPWNASTSIACQRRRSSVV